MRKTGPVKFENDLRKKLLSHFQKMKKLIVPFSIQEKVFCPIHAEKEFIRIIQITL